MSEAKTKELKIKQDAAVNSGEIKKIASELLSGAARFSEVSKGIFFLAVAEGKKHYLKFTAGYACTEPLNGNGTIEFGDGFPGQVALDGKVMNIADIPDGYLTIESGLAKGKPVSVILFPVKSGNKILGVVELASFRRFTRDDEAFFLELAEKAAEDIKNIKTKTV